MQEFAAFLIHTEEFTYKTWTLETNTNLDSTAKKVVNKLRY